MKRVVVIVLALVIVGVAVGVGSFFLLNAPPPDTTPPDTTPPMAVLTVTSIEGLTVSLSAEGSAAPRGEYEWDFGDNQVATVETITTTHTYAVPGAYVIVLTVRAAPTGDFVTQFSRFQQMVEVGGTGFAPSITIDQSTDGVNWKLLFSEVSQLQQQVIALELYDVNGVLLYRTPGSIQGLGQTGDEKYVRQMSASIAVGDYILLTASVYPAGTTYRLVQIDWHWTLAEGTLL